ncbi:hypothetical protein PILCRDRAFT_826419 [Piloderma croceum F 1598]|uniref:Uncharacterized protein n=1 Tax=Piloderma croceum (strain F 1598) TaxID=765440 RepID=A0A0C3F9J1_PILCF|nr:hypothetical protein PILCRDRAFT_826419 [Piloderma croceum F 1598]
MAYKCSESLSRVYISSDNLLPVAILKSSIHYIAGSDAAVLGPRAGDDLQVLKILVTVRLMFLNIAFLEVLSGPTLNHCVSF